MATGTSRPDASPPSALVPGWRWRRVFPGHERELSALRRWLASLLPECPARDDVVSVASELGSNAIQHTLSGRGAWFAVEITWYPSAVLVAVADCGGPAEPRVIDDPAGERGRGLLLVQGLSVRTGFTGDQRGRLVWAQIAWKGPGPAAHPPSQDPYQAAVHEGEAALARRFAGVPAWFGRSTLSWWAVAGPAGLVSAASARELAGLLYRLLEPPTRPRSAAAGQADWGTAGQPAPRPGRHADPPSRPRSHTASTGTGRPGTPGGRPKWRPALVPGLVAAGAAALARA